MQIKRTFRWLAFALALIVVIYLGWLIYAAAPLISAYGAKTLCSGIYLEHRSAAEFIRNDLSDFPFYIGTYTVDEKDSSVTGSVLGFAKRKAIYRQNAGATLLNDYTETEVRQQTFFHPSPPALNLDSTLWPNGNKLADTSAPGINKATVDKVLQRVMHEKFDGHLSATRGIIILYDGQLVAEKYAPGFDQYSRMPAWSMTKSITGSLIGILSKQNKLNINDAAPVSQWKDTDKKNITIKHLLQQCSGLGYTENYNRPSEATDMLFRKGNMAAYITQLPLIHTPGTVFNYSSGNSNILSSIVRSATGEEQYQSFPYTELLHRIGMYSAQLEPDASGTYVGSSYCYATARDFARFGLLYYNNGKWNSEQLLPENWVKEATQPYDADPLRNYGYQFWLNGFTDSTRTRRIFPSAPADLFYAAGYGGQYIFIIPSKKLVIVRLGLRNIDADRFLKEIIEAVK